MTTIFTLGYTGTKPEQIKALAARLHAVVVDVRFSPRSRVPQWAEANLKALLGKQYMHVKDLGNVNYRGDGPMKLLDPGKAAITLGPILKQQSVILLCACKDVETCHRKKAAEYLAEAFSLPVVHLGPKDLAASQKLDPKAEQESLL